MKKLAFICQKGQESFIEPIVNRFKLLTDAYQVRYYPITTQQEILAAIKWADVVFIEWANDVAILATQIYELRKKGCIVRLHSYEALSGFPQKIDWAMVDYLVFVAPHIRDIVKGHIPDIETKVKTEIVYNGIDLSAVTQNTNLSPYDIAYVCNINHKKEPALALQIMAELVAFDKKYRLHIAGAFQDQRYEIYMKHMAREMGIEGNIQYDGFVNDMSSWWNGKGIILSTSIHEGHPMNIIEGMARGLRPMIHNFLGAKGLYRPEWLFNTVFEAANLIELYGKENHQDIPLQHIIDRGWTLDTQVAQLTKLVEKAGKRV